MRFRGSADADEDKICSGDGGFEIGGKVKVFSTSGFDDLFQAGFIDGKSVGIPGVDTRLVHIANGDLDVRALGGDHCHGRAADVTGAEAADGCYYHKG